MGLGVFSKPRNFLPRVTGFLPWYTATTLDWRRVPTKKPNILRCMMFHNDLRQLCKTYSGYLFFCDNPSHKYCAFTSDFRYATYQGTLPLVLGLYKTWDEKGKKLIAASHPGAGLDKNQCSIQVTFHPRGVQPKTGVVFCGIGKRIS